MIGLKRATGTHETKEGPVLEIRDLYAGYSGSQVLNGVSFTVGPASILAVLGANGAGKTTLLNTISGSVPESRGQIRLFGDDLTRVPQEGIVSRGLAHVPEGHGLIHEFTVDENLRLGALWRRDKNAAAKDVAEIFELFPRLGERRQSLARQLSGGERQMLALGRALVSRPRILLLDEPSLGLAPSIVAEVMSMIRRLRDEDEVAVLLVEQNVRSALSVADSAVVLYLGSIVAEGTAQELDNEEELRHAYLGF